MDKKWTIAGTSTLDGVNTFRFATGKVNVRHRKLERHGHTEVELFQLPCPMTKQEAVAWLIERGKQAVIPTNRKDKPVELTEEQKQIAEEAAQREEANRARREKRAAARAAKIAAEDHNFLAEMTGGEKIDVPDDEEGHAEAVETDEEVVIEGAEEFLQQLAESAEPKEMGVDAEREAAGEG